MIFSTVGFRGNILRAMLIAGGAFNLFAQEPATQVSGIVKDAATQQPIADAFVTLLSNPDLQAMTDSVGAFQINLDGTPIRGGRGGNAGAGMSLRGTELAFSTGKSGARVLVTLHDLRGNRLAVLKDARLGAGSYTLSAAPSGLASGLYLVRAMVGSQARSFKMSTLAGQGSGSFRNIPSGSARLAKVAIGGIDFLVVQKEGYLKKNHEVIAYEDAQAVTLEPSKPATAKLGIFSDSALAQIDWANAAIYSWEQTALLYTDSTNIGFNGSVACMRVTTDSTAIWSGWAYHVAKHPNGSQPTVDLTPYAGGSLHLAVKGNAPNIGVTLSSPNQFAGTAPLIDLGTKGYLPDSLWHEITIPLTEFAGTLKLSDVFVYAGFVSKTTENSIFDPLATYYVDDVYYIPAP
ncbi:MAG: hypothetical protein JWP91_2677 [Fibrobacteres bacterium]|nr:hypothetical protein [Fibrobacterota bacterium]